MTFRMSLRHKRALRVAWDRKRSEREIKERIAKLVEADGEPWRVVDMLSQVAAELMGSDTAPPAPRTPSAEIIVSTADGPCGQCAQLHVAQERAREYLRREHGSVNCEPRPMCSHCGLRPKRIKGESAPDSDWSYAWCDECLSAYKERRAASGSP